jgi:hypothetical protein
MKPSASRIVGILLVSGSIVLGLSAFDTDQPLFGLRANAPQDRVNAKNADDIGDRLKSVGIQCAFCHSTVDNRIAPGIGSRLDGWANRDLNVGAIVALAPTSSRSPI